MEICIDSIESAKNAIAGGANRLEVCSSLSEGGLTPTPGLIKFIKKYSDKIKIYAMIRIRSGNFVYNRDEMDSMIYDLEILKLNGVDGFVFGALKKDASIDVDYCREILKAAKPLSVTFHRAFDVAINPFKSLETIIDLGFDRILTSGQSDTAIQGIDCIKRLIERAEKRIVIMPGSGINADNIATLKLQTGAREFHASARKRMEITTGATSVKIGSGNDDKGQYVMIASEELVRQMVDIIKNL